MIKNCDILIVNVPSINTDSPLQAPAVLKAAVEKHGFSAKTYDFNNEVKKIKDKQIYDVLTNYFSVGTLNLTSSAADLKIVNNFIDNCKNHIFKNYKTRWIGISVFTYQCQRAAEMLASAIKKEDYSIKIVFGGQGLGTMGIQANHSWAENLKKIGIIDHYIVSEGERTLVNLLRNVSGKGIDNSNWEQLSDLDLYSYPDYSDYDLNDYSAKRLMITGSRGCVRHCSFCDIHKHWNKFVFRSGKNIANEMINQSKKYNIQKFQFTDSLVNGSMKAYRDFTKELSDYNSNKQKKLSWSGQFIVRNLSQMNEHDWKITAQSGAEQLYLGVESGSESVRNHMKKQFSDKDLDDTVLQAHKNNIKLTFLMIVGYPTETNYDFQKTIEMFKKYKKYQNTITNVVLGTTLGILPGTPLLDHLDSDIDLMNGENFWVYDKNPTLDFKERIKRRILIGEICEELGYNVGNNLDNIKLLYFLWNVYKQKQKQTVIDMPTANLQDQKYS